MQWPKRRSCRNDPSAAVCRRCEPLRVAPEESNSSPHSFLFIHAGFFHLFFNMLVLVQSGRVAERLFGMARFIVLYMFAGLTGSLVSLLWHPGINSVGASGAIFGVLGAIVAYLVRHGSFVPRALYMRHLRLAVAFIAYALPSGFRHQGIDNGAHLGGLFGGLMLGLLLAPPPDESTERATSAQ
jgi:rhomboid protease GluP